MIEVRGGKQLPQTSYLNPLFYSLSPIPSPNVYQHIERVSPASSQAAALQKKSLSPHGLFSEVAHTEVFQFQFFVCGIDINLKMKVWRVHIKNLLNPLNNPVNPVLCQQRVLILAIAEKLQAAADISGKFNNVRIIRIVYRCILRSVCLCPFFCKTVHGKE